MGAYGDHVAYKPSKNTKTATKYNDEGDPVYDKPKQESKSDPFGWDNSKPTSQKFESYSKPKAAAENFEDTGYDGWNDVKRSSTNAGRNVPDPYSKSQTTKGYAYDPYPDQQQNSEFSNISSGDRRAKATTIVQKQKDFFEGNYNQSANAKQFDFNKSNQPKEFDFNSFPSKSSNKADDFDNVFDNAKSSNSKAQNDPFSWGNETSSSSQKAKQASSDFDFDFNAGKEKQNATVKKQNADSLFDVPASSPTKAEKFDPFAENAQSVQGGDNDLSSIKFDPPPQPVVQPKSDIFEAAAPAKAEVKVEMAKKLEPDELLSQKALLSLSTLSKNKSVKTDNKSDSFSNKFNQMNLASTGSGFTNTLSGNSFGDSSFPTSFGGVAKPPESKEERLNALES